MEWALQRGDVAAVPRLRRRIMHRLRLVAAPGSDLDATEIVVGELLSNALTHSGGPAWISLRWDGAHPLLSVADLGAGFAVGTGPGGAGGRSWVDVHGTLTPRLPQDLLAESGRGLYLVARLALDVAVAIRTSGGSVVSVTLNLQRSGPGSLVR